MKRILKFTGIGLLSLLLVVALFLRLRYGGGADYPDLSTSPEMPVSALETVFSYPEPLGNLAVSRDNRIFFTVHPESRPEEHKVMEIVDGKAVPFPDAAAQHSLFETVLGLFIDAQNHLWTVDHGNHGTGDVKVISFDINTRKVLYQHIFTSAIAPLGSFFNDLQVSNDGRYVYIADVSFFGKHPAIVVLDTQTGQAKRQLEDEPSVLPQDYIIRNPLKRMTFLGGLIALKPGVDGIVLSPDGQYIYYGAMTNAYLYRVRTKVLNDFSLPESKVNAAVEKIGQKPMSDGLSIDSLNNVYLTDVEHSGLPRMSPDGQLKTIIKAPGKIRWADGASFGGDGFLYFTDSAIPDQMLRSKSHMKAAGPYFIYRIKPTVAGVPGR